MRDAVKDCRTRAAENGLDRAGSGLLVRLAGSDDAAKAFGQLRLRDRRDEMAILQTCIQADQLFRTFPQQIENAEKMLGRAKDLDRAVVALRRIVDELSAEPPTFDLLSASIWYCGRDIAAMKQGLYLIDNLIEGRRRIANETRLRLGATRKLGRPKRGTGKKGQAANAVALAARQNAAIGFLAEGVRRVTGKTYLGAVRKIAEVILDTELSEDRVRNAARLRAREWRQR
jgi:hypothetical protein